LPDFHNEIGRFLFRGIASNFVWGTVEKVWQTNSPPAGSRSSPSEGVGAKPQKPETKTMLKVA